MILRLWKKIAHCCLIQQLFIGFFRNISILTCVYSIVILLLKLIKDFENLFSSYHKVNFRKRQILSIFCIIFQKIDIISDVSIAIAAILKFFFYQYFCNTKKCDCAKFHVKSIFLSGFMQGEGGGRYVPSQTKIPRGRQS